MPDIDETADSGVKITFMTASRKGTSLFLDKEGEFRMGRDPECEVHLPEPNVSRVHGKLVWDGRVLSVEDLKSTNGIFVNGEKVVSTAVRTGDVIAVGPAVFRVEVPLDGGSGVTIVRGAVTDTEETAAEGILVDGQVDQFQNLFECMLAIQRVLSEDRENMVEAGVDTLFLALPVTRLCLLRVNDGKELEPWLTRTRSGLTREFVMSKTFARKVLEAGKGILIQDALSLDAAEWGSTMQQQEVRSILGVPVFSKGATIAILLCDNLEKPNILRDVHVRTLEFFAKALETVFQREQIRSLEASQAATERQFLAAKRVQKQIFTKKPDPEMGGLRWAFDFRPALEVGGDFYDFVNTDEHVTWVLADVTGKGVSAALVVSMLKGFCKTLFPDNPSPRQMLADLNTLILDELPPEMFLTVLVLQTTPSGMLTFANAGHLPLFVVQQNPAEGEDTVARLKPPGVPLGFLEGAEFEDKIKEDTYQLSAGDRLCLCTDGVTEAANSKSEFYGEKRLIEELEKIGDKPVSEGVDSLIQAVLAFQGRAAQHDDITLILGEYQS